MVRKVFVIGLDGGTLDLLGPWMQRGWLPHLKQLMIEGVSGPLDSTIPPMTATAWSTFMTGKNPGKHGIYDFGVQEKGGYGYQVIDSRHRRERAIWDIISNNGGRVVVLNVPTTYPPNPVNGVLGGDFLTPSGRRDFLYPPQLLEEIEQRFGRFPLYVIPPYFAISQDDADIDRYVGEYEAALRYTFDLAHYLLDKIDPQFLMLHIFGNDQLCHWLWHVLDATHPQYRKDLFEKHFERILAYYHALDTEVGRLMHRGGEDTTTIVMSDHGFGPLHKVINLNTWLIREGYLALKGTAISRLRYLLWRLGFTPENIAQSKLAGLLVRRLMKRLLQTDQGTIDQLKKFHAWQQLFLSLNDVDWTRTKAFCLFGWGQIKINVKGKYPQGAIAPGPEYASLMAEIVGKLQEFRDPETGERVEGQVFTKDEVYEGKGMDEAPDITFLPMERNYWANSRGTGFASHRVFSTYLWGMTGMHRMKGMFLAKGKHLRSGVMVEDVNLMDLCPSILYLMGYSIPCDVDGKVLARIFRDDFLQAYRIEYEEGVGDGRLVSPTPSENAQEEVIQRLRDLGYL
jgi:predicted AlkP superfamily phosphohydrolase/phosphomutase